MWQFLCFSDLPTEALSAAFRVTERQQKYITSKRVERTNRRGKGLRGRDMKLRVGKVKEIKGCDVKLCSAQLRA
jgi:hypothetical protein